MTILVHAAPTSLSLYTAATERLAVRRQDSGVVRVPRPSAGRCACPVCGGPATRASRTLLDRLIAVLVRLPLRRWRCRDDACGWSGNLNIRHNGRHRRG